MNFTLNVSKKKKIVKKISNTEYAIHDMSSCGRYSMLIDNNDDFWLTVPRNGKIELYPMVTY